MLRKIICLCAMVLLVACSTSKFVPENEYLLDRVDIKSDVKGFDVAQLEPYIHQKGNSRWFSAFKIPLGTYLLAGKDSAKWINRTLHKMGEEPVLYDSIDARLSCEDLQLAMQNMGYMHATVDLETYVKGRKLLAIYTLHPNQPFIIRRFQYDIQDSTVLQVLQEKKALQSNYTPRQFTVSSLDTERKRLTKLLNDNGYYRFHKDFISYTVDSVRDNTDVDVTLHLHRYRANSEAEETVHPRFRIRHVFFEGGESTGLHLRKKVLENTSSIESGAWFSASDLQKTYNNFGRLGAVRYTNIRFDEANDSLLDCHLLLSNHKPNTLSFQPEGTNTAGDLGAAASLTYQNRNLFRGAELFSISLRAAFEAITGLEGYENHDYEEYGIETKLQFPRMVAPFMSRKFIRRSTATSELSLSWNMQNRPEFHRRVFSTAWKYRWTTSSRHTAYNFDLIDLNYVYMPWISPTFKEDYLDGTTNRNAILRYNYEDLFIMKIGFGLSYSDATHAVRANIETSGNLLGALSGILNFKKNEHGQHTLFNIAYAQYAKFDFDYTKLLALDNQVQLALHGGLGIAYPYGNSKVLPFEKRYFSGGANSVRGWSVRELGPGKFKGTDGRIDFINQTGDMRLNLNAELRTPLFWKFAGALFVDAGNIWTLRAYDEQPGGQFKLNEFYKQIAASYGIGFRLNFDYFILRADMGMKAVNPVYGNSDEHFPVFHPKFSRDFTFHFAVGMPF